MKYLWYTIYRNGKQFKKGTKMNRFPLNVKIEFYNEFSEFKEVEITHYIYEESNFFQEVANLLVVWEEHNKESEIMDYKVTNQLHYNEWKKNQM